MVEGSEMMNVSSQESSVSMNESDTSERKKQISKNRMARGLPRHPMQRHCRVRRTPAKRKKRRLLSASTEITNIVQEPSCSNELSTSCSQFSESSSSSSSSSPTKNIVAETKGRKRKPVIDKCDGRGETALHKAAIKGDVKLVKSLLRRGANPNHQDYAGWTPLHEACIRGWYGVAQALLKAGANANTPGLHNVTALHDATAWSHIPLVKLLLKYGANLTSKNDKGDTPVELATGAVLYYLESHGLIPERRTIVVPERTDEMRKSTYRSKVVKANSADVTFKIKVRCEQKGEDRTVSKHNKKPKKKKSSRLSHSKKKMDSEETKQEPSVSKSPEKNNEIDDEKPSTTEEPEEAASGTGTSSTTAAVASSSNVDNNCESESRRSSVSLDDDDDGKRNKRRKEKDEHATRTDEPRSKEEHGSGSVGKKDEHQLKKEEQPSKKEDHGHKKDEKAKSNNVSNNSSPKSTSSLDGVQEADDGCSKGVDSPGPKVPPLKIVIPPAESEQGSRNGKNTTRHHPYVVVTNDETPAIVTTLPSSPSSPSATAVITSTAAAVAAAAAAATATATTTTTTTTSITVKDEPETTLAIVTTAAPSTSSTSNTIVTTTTTTTAIAISASSTSVNTTLSTSTATAAATTAAATTEEQRSQQRVLRSSKSGTTSGCSSTNGNSSGANSNATSAGSSPAAPELSPQQDTMGQPIKDEPKTKNDSPPGRSCKMENTGKTKPETPVKVKSEAEEETPAAVAAAAKSGITESRTTAVSHPKEEPNAVELHPRKRKLKTRPEPAHIENDSSTAFGAAPHPHEVPVTNCYQMFMDIRRQIDAKRKGLFPIQPKPPQGFKDYLMNRCTYTLNGNSLSRLKRRNAEPPEGIPDGMKELYEEQESERYSLRMQHIVEKEKLVLSVEQEILRVHGRAARALANQALPFSACTILKDEEVYNVITPEQEEKDRNARSRYNGRLFISWLQDVDDKWEKIKEEMLARHRKEAESLNAVQKFNWDLKMRELGLWKKKEFFPVETNCVPMLSVSDDFDMLPE